MTTQERLTNYEQQAQKKQMLINQIIGEMAERQETLEAEQKQLAMLTGAIQATKVELQAQQQAQPAA